MKPTIGSLCVHYLFQRKKLFFVALFFCFIYGVTSGFGLPVIFEKVFRQIFEDKTHNYSLCQILLIAGFVPIGFLLRGFFGYCSTYWLNRCGLEILNRLRLDIFTKLQYLDISFFDKKNSGDLINRIVNDPKTLQEVLLEMASEFFKQPLQMLAAFIGLIYLSFKNCDWVFLLIFIVAMPICFVPVKLLRKRVKSSSRVMQQTEAEVTENVVENLRAVQEIRQYSLEVRSINKTKSLLQKLADRIQTVVQWQKLQQPLMEFVTAGIISVIFIYAYYKQIPFSLFSAMGMALYFAFDPIKKISNTVAMMHRATGALERIVEVLEEPIRVKNTQSPICKKIEGHFCLNAVNFRYEDSSKEWILKDIQVEIPLRQMTALVGPSGAGKSTFIKLLPRLYDVSSGVITLDEIPLKEWNIECLRKHVAVVSQNAILFNDTIAHNIEIGRPGASQEEMIQAAKAAYAHDFILEMGGYDCLIGENGCRLSGGQRQRLAIARAFLKNAPILILDEATAALDAESEYFIRKAIDTLGQDKTIIAIAHRLSTIQNAHNILVFENGHIVAQGTHAQLLAQNSLYQNLVQKQLITT